MIRLASDSAVGGDLEMKKNANIVEFNDVNEWIRFSYKVQEKYGDLISPGGFARLAGVSRQAVNNWIYRDKKIRYIKCKAEGGEYGLIPVADLENVIPVERELTFEV